MNEVAEAREFCVAAHAGQFRRDGVTPYHTHPFVVASRVPEELKAAAYLHDVVEDTNTTLTELEHIFSPRTCRAVESLTRRGYESYNQYIFRVLENLDAVKIKIADMEHNLSCQPSERSLEKCALWLPVLKSSVDKET